MSGWCRLVVLHPQGPAVIEFLKSVGCPMAATHAACGIYAVIPTGPLLPELFFPLHHRRAKLAPGLQDLRLVHGTYRLLRIT